MSGSNPEYQRRWRQNNPEKVRQYNRTYTRKNREKIKAYRKKWSAENKGRQAEYEKEYREKVEKANGGSPNSRKLWTDAEMKALAEWTGTEAEFAIKYGRSLQAVQRKKARIRES